MRNPKGKVGVFELRHRASEDGKNESEGVVVTGPSSEGTYDLYDDDDNASSEGRQSGRRLTADFWQPARPIANQGEHSSTVGEHTENIGTDDAASASLPRQTGSMIRHEPRESSLLSVLSTGITSDWEDDEQGSNFQTKPGLERYDGAKMPDVRDDSEESDAGAHMTLREHLDANNKGGGATTSGSNSEAKPTKKAPKKHSWFG